MVALPMLMSHVANKQKQTNNIENIWNRIWKRNTYEQAITYIKINIKIKITTLIITKITKKNVIQQFKTKQRKKLQNTKSNIIKLNIHLLTQNTKTKTEIAGVII